jgi:hypothetical protein
MGREDDRKLTLLVCHARLKMAQEMLQWALTTEAESFMSRDEHQEIQMKLGKWMRSAYNKATNRL